MQISLRGGNPDELKAIVNAVTAAYLTEAVNTERNRQSQRIDKLEAISNQWEERYRGKRKELETLGARFLQRDVSLVELNRKVSMDHIAHLKRELTRINLELSAAEVEQTAQRDSTSTSATEASKGDVTVAANPSSQATSTQFDRRVAVLKAQQVVLRSELEADKFEIARSTDVPLDVKLLDDEIERIARTLSALGAETDSLRLQVQAPLRVQELQTAIVTKVTKN